jgi:hypothetical protein
MSRFTDKIDMRFEYTHSSKTDIRRSIARERKRLDEERKRREAEAEAARKAGEEAEQEAVKKVCVMKKGAVR